MNLGEILYSVLNQLDWLRNNLESFYINNKHAKYKSSSLSSDAEDTPNSAAATAAASAATAIKLKKFNIENSTTTTTKTTTNAINLNNCNQYNINDLIQQIKTCLCLLSENFTAIQSHPSSLLQCNNNNNNNLNSNKMDVVTKLVETTDVSLSQKNETLMIQNRNLKERLKELEESRKKEELEICQMKETIEMMRSDRKRLKCEKLDLLNQTRDLYKVIESKENEIRDVLKAYELRTKETSFAVKKIIDSKVEIEKDKNKLELQIMDLIEEKNQLNMIVESKNATISKLQKHIYELKSSSPRNSLGKESDCGYSSSSTKSRDTLSSSLIDANLNVSTSQTPMMSTLESSASGGETGADCSNIISSLKQHQPSKNNHHQQTKISSSSSSSSSSCKSRKEERTLKCKSNDSYIYLKNGGHDSTPPAISQPQLNKLNYKFKNKFTKITSLPPPVSAQKTDELLTDTNHGNGLNNNNNNSNHLNLALISSNEYDTDLSRVLDSDEFIDLDDVHPTKQLIDLSPQNNAQSTTNTNTNNATSSVSSVETNVTSENGNEKPTTSTCSLSSSNPIVQSNLASSLSQSVSLTSSSVSSYKTEETPPPTVILKEENLDSDVVGDESSCNFISNSANTSSTTTTTTSQPFHVKSRSSRILNTLIRMSTIGNGISSSSNTPNRASALIESSSVDASQYATTLSSSKIHKSGVHNTNSNTLSSKSSYYVNEITNSNKLTEQTAFSSQNKLYKSVFLSEHKFDSLAIRHSCVPTGFKHVNCLKQISTIVDPKESIIKEESLELIGKPDLEIPLAQKLECNASTTTKVVNIDLSEILKSEETSAVEKWSQSRVKVWLESIGMLPFQIKNAMKFVKNGKSLTSMTDGELEKAFALNNSIHKRKLRLAIDEIKYPEKCKYPKLSEINTDWIANIWLKEIGLIQFASVFKLNLVDGRLLASLQKKDIEKHFGIQKRCHQTSLLLAIDFLRKYDFDISKLKSLKETQKENRTGDVSLWVNDNFADWLKLVNLHEFLPNLSQSGLHGALVADSSFNTEFLFNALCVGDELKYQNMRKILEDEIKLLKKTKHYVKNDSVLMRSFKNDKRIFTFRGSLGRALGKKIKRDISSPLIDDDTYKRIEFSHKIIDMKDVSSGSVV